MDRSRAAATDLIGEEPRNLGQARAGGVVGVGVAINAMLLRRLSGARSLPQARRTADLSDASSKLSGGWVSTLRFEILLSKSLLHRQLFPTDPFLAGKISQILTQALAGPVKSAHDGPDRDFQGVGNLLVRQFFDGP